MPSSSSLSHIVLSHIVVSRTLRDINLSLLLPFGEVILKKSILFTVRKRLDKSCTPLYSYRVAFLPQKKLTQKKHDFHS